MELLYNATELLEVERLDLYNATSGSFEFLSNTNPLASAVPEKTIEYGEDDIVITFVAIFSISDSCSYVTFNTSKHIVAIEDFQVSTSSSIVIEELTATIKVTINLSTNLIEYCEVDYSTHISDYINTHLNLLDSKYSVYSELSDVKVLPYYIVSDCLALFPREDSLLRYSGRYIRGSDDYDTYGLVIVTHILIEVSSLTECSPVMDVNLYSFILSTDKSSLYVLFLAVDSNNLYELIGVRVSDSNSLISIESDDFSGTTSSDTEEIIQVDYPYIRKGNLIYYISIDDTDSESPLLTVSTLSESVNDFYFCKEFLNKAHLMFSNSDYYPSELDRAFSLQSVTNLAGFSKLFYVYKNTEGSGFIRALGTSISCRYNVENYFFVSNSSVLVIYTNNYSDLYYLDIVDGEPELKYKEVGVPLEDNSGIYFKGLEVFSRCRNRLASEIVSSNIIGECFGCIMYYDPDKNTIESL